MSLELSQPSLRERRATDDYRRQHHTIVGELGDLEMREANGEDIADDLKALVRENRRLQIKTWLRLRVVPLPVRTVQSRIPVVSPRPRERRSRRVRSSGGGRDPDEPEAPLGRLQTRGAAA